MNPGKHPSSKKKRPRFRLEGPRPCTSSAFHSYTMHELRNRNVSVGQWHEHT